jgi:hypothetical protein
MKIINVFSDNDLTGLSLFNPNNLPVKKIFVYKNRAIAIAPNVKHYKGNRITVNGKIYKLCTQCSRFFLLSDTNFPHCRKSSDGFDYCCRECRKTIATLRYLQNREYHLLNQRINYYKALERKGFPKDMRRIENRKASAPKHNHLWSNPGKWNKRADNGGIINEKT